MYRLKITIIFLFIVAGHARPQKADASSGATLTTAQIMEYSRNDSVRRLYNNDPFDNNQLYKLEYSVPEVTGELINPGIPGIEGISIRSVMVKEVVKDEKNNEESLSGAFVYYGFPLADLLNNFIIDKRNAKEFGLMNDLYVVVTGRGGDKAVFSWGEIYFSASGRNIILATGVRPVFPTHDTDRWDIPHKGKVVAGNDLMAFRNISDPAKIEILSFPVSFPGEKGFTPLYSPEILLNTPKGRYIIDTMPDSIFKSSFQTLFFGMHMGSRGFRSFEGVPLSDLLGNYIEFSDNEIRSGIIAFGALDGYRAVFSVSEIVNRSDTGGVLVSDAHGSDDGRFIIRPPADFFADRHLKGVNTGHLIVIE